MHFYYMTFGHTLAEEPPAPEVMIFYNLVESSLVIITIHLLCLKHAPEYRGFFKNTLILHFLPQNYLPLVVGVMKF